MFKGLKNLFTYKKPDDSEFELTEDPNESMKWDQYLGKHNNLTETAQKSDQNQDGNNQEFQSQTNQDQVDVRDRLIQIMRDSEESESTGQGKGTSKPDNNESDKKLKLDGDSASENDTGSKISQTKKGQDQSDKGDNKGESLETSNKILNIKNSTEKDTESTNQNRGRSLSKPMDKDVKKDNDINKEDIVFPRIKTPLPLDEFIKEKQKERAGDKLKSKEQGKNKQKEKQENGETTEYLKVKENLNSEGHKKEDTKAHSEDKNMNCEKAQQKSSGTKGENNRCVSTKLEQNVRYLEKAFHIPINKDVIIRRFNVAREIPAFAIFVDGMIDHTILVQFTLPQLMDVHPFRDFEGGCPLDYIEKNVITIHQISRMKEFEKIIPQVLSGLAVIFIDGCNEALVLESRGFERRGVEAPVTETVVNGPQEGFVETLRTNITLVRRILKSKDLITEFEFVTKPNNFLCAIMYMDGITNPRIVNEVKRRIKSISVDYISGTGMMEQLIEDRPMMLFPQVISTERPDRAASFLMDGKVVIICEGAPFALAMPITFFDLIHTSEETNSRWMYGSFMRIVRLMGVLLAAVLPGMYTALILFHQEMIPTSLLASIVVSRALVPFPTIIEILLMEFSFELIREGGIRVPGVTGNTLGIIGALILGQAAVEAGLVSPILIIIVAVSGLGSFAIPNYSLSLAIRIIRFILIFFGCMAGFYGISVAFTIICALALSMKSFGVPFFAPVAPATRSNKDKIIRGPIYMQTYRPDFLNTLDKKAMASNPRSWESGEKRGGAGNAEGR